MSCLKEMVQDRKWCHQFLSKALNEVSGQKVMACKFFN